MNRREDIQEPGDLPPQELEAVYEISRAVARAMDTERALDEITQIARPVFIFDNMVMYEPRDGHVLEPTYARAIGRGRFLEADLAWGESIANDSFQRGQPGLRVEELPESETNEDRTSLRYFLSLPLHLGGTVMGVLVFIRFGGPAYTREQIHLAEYIGIHVAQLLEHSQLVERVAALEAKRRLDSLQDDFIAMISHELLTPLGFIKGYATTLLREDIDWENATRREFLTIIDEESDRLRELIDNLMDSSRLQAGTLYMNFQPLRLDTLLKDMALRATTRDETLTIQVDIEAAGLQIQGDPARLAQVFDNLITNAAKYAPGSPITIALRREGDACLIAVQDQGPGIPLEHQANLFRRFYRVPGGQTSIRGTGLGLYICRQIVQAHHGEISAASTPGAGATFTLRLPCQDLPGAAA
jgi:signal transduction histidine kinase